MHDGSKFLTFSLTLVTVFLMLAIIVGVKYYLLVVWIYTFFLYAYCLVFFEGMPFARFKIWSTFYCWVVNMLFVFWIQVPHQVYYLHRFFSYSASCSFHFIKVSFGMQTFLILRKSNFPIFAFCCLFGVIFKNHSLARGYEDSSLFSSKGLKF